MEDYTIFESANTHGLIQLSDRKLIHGNYVFLVLLPDEGVFAMTFVPCLRFAPIAESVERCMGETVVSGLGVEPISDIRVLY